ncbi:hypothetical protein CR513_59327, partial [Mucuna pruriens]
MGTKLMARSNFSLPWDKIKNGINATWAMQLSTCRHSLSLSILRAIQRNEMGRYFMVRYYFFGIC